MAEPDYSAAPTWPHLTTGPGSQGAELAAPLLSAHAPFQQQLPPLYGDPYLAMNNHSISRNNDILDVPVSNQSQGRSPYPPPGTRYPYYNHPHLFSYQFHGPPRPPPAFWNAPEQMHGDPAFFDHSNMMQGYSPMLAPGTSPHHHQTPGSVSTGMPLHLQRRYDHRMAVDALARSSHAGGVRAPHQGSQEPASEARLPSVRSQPQDHQQVNEASRSSSGPRPWMSPDEQGRRSDRSISPRTSNRRSYDRYSVDILPHSSTSSDAEEAAARAPPLNRMRHRPRDVRPRFASHRPHIDPNIATCRQIQELKDGLSRRLPSELPEDASKACDICQKDYSTSHVTPKEEEEIAIVLPCGHSFGEFCISQWFDTCRTHKNKVTCPMCRKQLIEAPRYVQTTMHAFPRSGQAFVDLLAHEQLLAHGIPRDLDNL